MNAAERKQILSRGRPGPRWPGEPLLGGYYTDEEFEAVTRAMRDAMDPTVGFGFICREIEELEAAFAAHCGTHDCLTVHSADTGVIEDTEWLDLQPRHEVV